MSACAATTNTGNRHVVLLSALGYVIIFAFMALHINWAASRLKATIRNDGFAVAARKVARNVRYLVYSSIVMLFRKMRSLAIFRSPTLRGIVFDSASHRDSVVVGDCGSELFVVSAIDKIIGRDLFIKREPCDFFKLKRVLQIINNFQPDMLIDVGANIGTICIPAIKRHAFQRAIAIEPEPHNFELLVANIYLNGLATRIETHNLALGSTDNESVLFELADENLGDHRIHVSSDLNLLNEHNRKVITVKSTTLDRLVKTIEPNTTLIWMDTQGFEGHILAGSGNTLLSHPPVCAEFWPYGMSRNRSFSLLKSSLRKAGYDFFVDLGKEPLRPVPLNDQSLNELYDKLGEGGNFTDLLVLSSRVGHV